MFGLAEAPVSLGLFYREQSELVEFKDAELRRGARRVAVGAGGSKRRGVRQQIQQQFGVGHGVGS